jgi:hypothetical protein
MLRRTLTSLNLAGLITRFGQFAKQAEDRPAFLGHEQPKAAPDRLETLRARLYQDVDALDQQLKMALNHNAITEWTRLFFLVLMGLIITVAVPFGLVEQAYLVSVFGGSMPIVPIVWVLSSLRALRDDRIQLQMMILRYRPRVGVCATIQCLNDVAREIELTLRLLTPQDPRQSLRGEAGHST